MNAKGFFRGIDSQFNILEKLMLVVNTSNAILYKYSLYSKSVNPLKMAPCTSRHFEQKFWLHVHIRMGGSRTFRQTGHSVSFGSITNH